MLPGGEPSAGELALTGPLTEASLADFAVADVTKFSRTGLAFVAPPSAFDAIITEESAPGHETDALAAAGVTVRKV